MLWSYWFTQTRAYTIKNVPVITEPNRTNNTQQGDYLKLGQIVSTNPFLWIRRMKYLYKPHSYITTHYNTLVEPCNHSYIFIYTVLLWSTQRTDRPSIRFARPEHQHQRIVSSIHLHFLMWYYQLPRCRWLWQMIGRGWWLLWVEASPPAEPRDPIIFLNSREKDRHLRLSLWSHQHMWICVKYMWVVDCLHPGIVLSR